MGAHTRQRPRSRVRHDRRHPGGDVELHGMGQCLHRGARSQQSAARLSAGHDGRRGADGGQLHRDRGRGGIHRHGRQRLVHRSWWTRGGR